METVKSLQMEPRHRPQYGDYLAQYLAAGFTTRQVGNTYNVVANGLEQVMTLSILIVGALLVMQNDGFTVGMLVAFQMFASRMSQPHAAPGRPVAGIPAGQHRGQAPRRHHGHAAASRIP